MKLAKILSQILENISEGKTSYADGTALFTSSTILDITDLNEVQNLCGYIRTLPEGQLGYVDSLKQKGFDVDSVGTRHVLFPGCTFTHNLVSRLVSVEKYESAIYLLDFIKLIFKENGFDLEYAKCLLNIGQIYYHSGQYRQALRALDEAEPILKKFNTKAIGSALSLRNLIKKSESKTSSGNENNKFEKGRKLYLQGKFENAEDIFLECVILFEQSGEPEKVAKSYSMIAICNQALGDKSSAINSLGKSFEIFENLTLYSNAGNVANQIGNIEEGRRNYSSAEVAYKKAIRCFQIGNDWKEVADSTFRLAKILREMSQYNAAIEQCESAEKIFSKIGSNELENARVNLTKSRCYLGQVTDFYTGNRNMQENFNLIQVLSDLSNVEKALAYCKPIFFLNKSLPDIGNYYMMNGNYHFFNEQLHRKEDLLESLAYQNLQQSLSIFTKLNNLRMAEIVTINTASVLNFYNHHDLAIELMKKYM